MPILYTHQHLCQLRFGRNFFRILTFFLPADLLNILDSDIFYSLLTPDKESTIRRFVNHRELIGSLLLFRTSPLLRWGSIFLNHLSSNNVLITFRDTDLRTVKGKPILNSLNISEFFAAKEIGVSEELNNNSSFRDNTYTISGCSFEAITI